MMTSGKSLVEICSASWSKPNASAARCAPRNNRNERRVEDASPCGNVSFGRNGAGGGNGGDSGRRNSREGQAVAFFFSGYRHARRHHATIFGWRLRFGGAKPARER